MLDGKYDDFLDRFIGDIVHQIGITPRYQFAHASNTLSPPDLRKQEQVVERFKDGGSDAKCSPRISLVNCS